MAKLNKTTLANKYKLTLVLFKLTTQELNQTHQSSVRARAQTHNHVLSLSNTIRSI